MTYLIKKKSPPFLLSFIRNVKTSLWQLFYQKHRSPIPLEQQFPWSSPNIWDTVVDFYKSRSNPVIFEYGIGASSLNHLPNLLVLGGKYVGVEHNVQWYKEVVKAVVNYTLQSDLDVTLKLSSIGLPSNYNGRAYDANFEISGKCESVIKLKLRPAYNRSNLGDGTIEEFREYVYALDEPCDVVIIDGRARKACVNYVLDTCFLKPGGLLGLFEAGRGVEGWLGSPALTGTFNYQPEVKRMLALGGVLHDGNGLDNWPDLKFRRTMGSQASFYPIEACFLVQP